MKRLTAALLLLVAAAGCIFSPDESTVRASDPWSPELYVTPDSVYAWFPNDWPDTTTWSWNRLSPGAWEYIMEASVELSLWPDRRITIHVAFVHESDCTGPRTGTFREMAEAGVGYIWTENPETREFIGGPFPFCVVRVCDDGVEVRAWNSAVDLYLGNPPRDRAFWAATFTRRGLFEPKVVRRPAHYEHDVLQERVRAVQGPLGLDDYVIMDLVARGYAHRDAPGLVLEPVTILTPTSTYVFFNEVNNIRAILRPDGELLARYNRARVAPVDVGALSQLGYVVVDAGEPWPGNYVHFSAIGYNAARDQAMMYGSYHCGNLCAEGEVILLQKVRGYWAIKNRVMLWIS